ncbi:MAG: hypothetical protein MUE67_02405, partial [Anaerolineales bacterium]|nr:hypothetical protein [Anaerolineales bacterium]
MQNSLQTAFRDHFNSEPELWAQSPGRVNLLGEHVDYNAGPVLPAAIDRQVDWLASTNSERIVHLAAMDIQQSVQFHLDQLEQKTDLEGRPLPGWALYPAGVAWALQEAGFSVRGLNATYSSNVPIGAGLSSSAAVEVGFGALWQTIEGWELDRLSLARVCQRAENEYAGVACG